MKVIRNFYFIVVLIQLSEVFAAPRNSPHNSQLSTPGSQPASGSSSMPRSSRNESRNQNFIDDLSDSDTDSQLDDEEINFQKWNNYLKEYVRENIPDIKQNKAIRDYLLRVEYWAPRSLSLHFKDYCESAQYNFIMESVENGTLILPLPDDQCRKLAYGALKTAMDNVYALTETFCREAVLVDETAILSAFRVNKFLVFKTIGEQAYQLFDVEKLPMTDENIWKSILDGLKYVKVHFEPLPCPYQYVHRQ